MKRRDFLYTVSGALAAALSTSELYAYIQRHIQNAPPETNFDVIVLGVGSMGASACYHLAKRGYRVLGIEQFDIPHEYGSHAGQSRVIRKAYGEGSGYVPLLERAYQNWKTLESETGSQVYYKTGLLYFAEPDDAFLKSVISSSQKYNIPIDFLSEAECSQKYPQFKLPKHFQRLFEHDAGFITPEKSILLLVEQALRKGAVIRTREKAIEWKREKGTITLTTNKGNYQAKKLILTAGAWTSKLIPSISSKLTVTRQAIAWVKTKTWEDFTLGTFPCWLLKNKDYGFYGFPILPSGNFGGPLGMKLALHYPGEIIDPDTGNRTAPDSDEKILVDFLNEFIPNGYERTLTVKTCLYTNSPDTNFIIDYLNGFDKDVAFAAGFSGHGFKFVSVIGEILADLVINGTTSLPIEFLSAKRFG